MLVIGLDTSTMVGGVSLVGPDGLVGEYVLNVRSTHSERLLPAVERVLEDAGVSLDTVDGIAVVTGPGSFTGLRIGAATAKGFAYALKKPVVGVSVLEALAWQFQWFSGLVCSLIDARRQTVYAQVFRRLQPVTGAVNCSVAAVVATCCSQSEPVLFAGDGALVYEQQLNDAWMVLPSREQRVLHTASVAGLGRKLLLEGRQTDAMTLVPTYMRKSEAELKWEQKT